MADVRAYFGIMEGGPLALTAVALLTGGDYNVGGAEKVGHKLVRHGACHELPDEMHIQMECKYII